MTSHSLFFYMFVKSHLAWRTQADWCLCLKFQTRYSQWKHPTWRIIYFNFARNISKSPGQHHHHQDRGRIRPPPTRQASSPAPWASSWSWQDGSQSCSTGKVVKSIKMTFQVGASWPGNSQRTPCPSSLGQKDTPSCSWKTRSSVFKQMRIVLLHLYICAKERKCKSEYKHSLC